MHCILKLTLTLLGLGCALFDSQLWAQPEAMPATVITAPRNSDALGVSPTNGLAYPNGPSNFNAPPSSGVMQTAYGQVVGPPIQDPYTTPAIPTQAPRGLSDPAGIMQEPVGYGDPWNWQILPDGLIYRDYLADREEARFASQNFYDSKIGGWFWDVTLGGHVALLRYGSQDPQWPEGFEFDMEGGVFPRLNSDRELVSADYRFGLPLTYRAGPWEFKFGYDHLSSHLGDIYIEATGAERINYVREQALLAVAYRPIPDVRFYGEASYAFHYDGGAEPWEFKFGAEYSPSGQTGIQGAPFFAVNVDLREDVNYSGNITAEGGWQWRGPSGHMFRVGGQFFNGYSDQRQFYRQYENYIGFGIWYDF